MSELSQFDDGNVLTHSGPMANRKKRGRRPLDYPDEKSKVSRLRLRFHISETRE